MGADFSSEVMFGVACAHYKEHGQMPAGADLEKLAKTAFTKIQGRGLGLSPGFQPHLLPGDAIGGAPGGVPGDIKEAVILLRQPLLFLRRQPRLFPFPGGPLDCQLLRLGLPDIALYVWPPK